MSEIQNPIFMTCKVNILTKSIFAQLMYIFFILRIFKTFNVFLIILKFIYLYFPTPSKFLLPPSCLPSPFPQILILLICFFFLFRKGQTSHVYQVRQGTFFPNKAGWLHLVGGKSHKSKKSSETAPAHSVRSPTRSPSCTIYTLYMCRFLGKS